jgi:hypothetical protein
MIAFKADTELEIIDKFNEETDNIEESHKEVFHAGEPVCAEIVNEEPGDKFVTIQYDNDGSISVGVQRSCFDVLPDHA